MDHASCPWGGATPRPSAPPNYQIGDVLCSPDFKVKYVFRQALGVTELEAVNPEEILGAVTGTGGDDVLVAILTQFIKSSVTLQVVMVVFMTGVMVDVVTAFALSILPIVFFYKFLPMSDRVRLGDYGGAAFALLSIAAGRIPGIDGRGRGGGHHGGGRHGVRLVFHLAVCPVGGAARHRHTGHYGAPHRGGAAAGDGGHTDRRADRPVRRDGGRCGRRRGRAGAARQQGVRQNCRPWTPE